MRQKVRSHSLFIICCPLDAFSSVSHRPNSFASVLPTVQNNWNFFGNTLDDFSHWDITWNHYAKFRIVYNLQFLISKIVNCANFLTKVGNTGFLLHSFVSIEAPKAKKSRNIFALFKKIVCIWKKYLFRKIFHKNNFFWKTKQFRLRANLQGDPSNQNCSFQRAITLKLSTSDLMLVKLKCV